MIQADPAPERGPFEQGPDRGGRIEKGLLLPPLPGAAGRFGRGCGQPGDSFSKKARFDPDPGRPVRATGSFGPGRAGPGQSPAGTPGRSRLGRS